MDLRIVRLPVTPDALEAYAVVPARGVIATRLNLPALMDTAGLRFVEEPVAQARLLDSDLHEGPLNWTGRGDLDRWIMVCAFDRAERAGGAIVAVQPDDHWFFPPQPDLALLWDIRVAERWRRQGVGRRLVLEAAACAADAGCRRLAIETQDVNVAACRLYASAGAVLGEVRPGAYREHPDEVALLWYMDL